MEIDKYKEEWDKFIRDNFGYLTSTTKTNTEMIGYLYQTQIIPSTSLHILSDETKPNETRAKELYMGLKGECNPTVISDLLVALEKGRNSGAAEKIREGMKKIKLIERPQHIDEWDTASGVSVSAESRSKSIEFSNPLQAFYRQKIIQQRSASGPSRIKPFPDPSCPYPSGKKLALIINVTHKRPGTNYDVTNLQDVLTHCGFDVEICAEQDCTEKGIDAKIQDFKKTLTALKAENLGGCLVALMSHGTYRDRFSDQKGKPVDLKKHIIAPFNAEECPVLEHIPKIFLINICRGDKEEVYIQTKTENASEPELEETVPNDDWDEYFGTLRYKSVSTKKEGPGDESEAAELTPLWMHMLIGLSSIDDHVSYRDEAKDFNGRVLYASAVYIREFCNAVKTFAEDRPVDIYKIFQRVSHAVSKETTPVKLKDGKTGIAKQLPLLMNKGFCLEFPLHYNPQK